MSRPQRHRSLTSQGLTYLTYYNLTVYLLLNGLIIKNIMLLPLIPAGSKQCENKKGISEQHLVSVSQLPLLPQHFLDSIQISFIIQNAARKSPKERDFASVKCIRCILLTFSSIPVNMQIILTKTYHPYMPLR